MGFSVLDAAVGELWRGLFELAAFLCWTLAGLDVAVGVDVGHTGLSSLLRRDAVVIVS